MNILSRTITGIVMVFLGLFLIFLKFFIEMDRGGFLASLFYGIFILIIGFFILFNKKEDSIEKIKEKK